MNRLRVAAVAAVVAVAVAVVPSALSRADAEPEAFQLWMPTKQPRASRQFTGIVVTLLQQSEITMRPETFRFRCARAAITPHGKRKPLVYAPVRVVKLPDRGPVQSRGEAVIGIWVCTWTVPRATAGWKMVTSYSATAIGRDPATGTDIGPSSLGGQISWTVSR